MFGTAIEERERDALNSEGSEERESLSERGSEILGERKREATASGQGVPGCSASTAGFSVPARGLRGRFDGRRIVFWYG